MTVPKRPAWLDLGTEVVTPSGRFGVVVAIEATLQGIEATVEWSSGDRGCFRVEKLRGRA